VLPPSALFMVDAFPLDLKLCSKQNYKIDLLHLLEQARLSTNLIKTWSAKNISSVNNLIIFYLL